MSKTSIIILTYNNLDYTRLCLDSIFAKTDHPEFEVILVDNASTDGTPAFLEEYAKTQSNLKFILNSSNLGFAGGNNQGASAATGEYLVFLNNDVIVTRGWLSTLTSYLRDPQVGMVGPVTNSSGNECQIPVDYTGPDGLDAFAERYTREHQGQSFEIKVLPFQCVAMRKVVFDEIGPLDERFGIGMFEDDDYAFRLARKGYRILCTEDAYIHHWGSASFSKLSFADYWDLFATNLQKFEEKWGISWIPHTQRPEFIPQQYRQLLDGSMSMARQVTNLSGVASELEGIKNSNSWAFLQSIMRLRRRLIPEHSKREQFFFGLLRTLRSKRPQARISGQPSPQVSKDETAFPKVAPGRSQQLVSPDDQRQGGPASQDGAVQSRLSDRFPWPLVSVILPVYNHADMVEQAARSVLFSSYRNIELIILDDGSVDNIEPALERLTAYPRVRVFRQPNQKLPRALTHGHLQARGDLITWTSADNLMEEDALQTMVDALLANPEAVMVYADVKLIDKNGDTLLDGSYRTQNLDPSLPGVVRLHQNSEPLGYELDNYINACFLYRRQAAQALDFRFADDLRGLEDYDFWLRLQKCGKIVHVRNQKPLYHYRVHKRTMSHVLLSKELDPHIQRGRKFIAYEAERRAYTQKRWSLVLDKKLLPAMRQKISYLQSKLPADDYHPSQDWPLERKLLHFVPHSLERDDPIYVRVYTKSWQLVWRSGANKNWNTLDVWGGIDISPLALKAREYQIRSNHYARAGERPVFGCHTSLKQAYFDLDLTREIISRNPWAFFVFIDFPGLDHPDLGQQLVSGLENALYLGSLPFGEPYQLYAGFDWVWMPPLSESSPADLYPTQLALAYAIARPLVASGSLDFVPAPYQYYYLDGGSLYPFASEPMRFSMDPELLDRYLESWTCTGRLSLLLRLANGVTQDMAVPRPDFEIEPPPMTYPAEWLAATGKDQADLRLKPRLKCAFVTNTLDKGGLEQVIASLVRGLPAHGIDPFVLCVNSGGLLADSLTAEGAKVYIAGGSRSAIVDILREEKPDLVSTHFVDPVFLQVAYELGLPVVETIHNTYVWLDSYGWYKEKQRSRYFFRTVAVSELVRQYYLKKNPAYIPEWISVLPNSIDTTHLEFIGYEEARQRLGIHEDEVLFLSVASYNGAKNQLGLLNAFDQLVKKHPQARLYCVGNTLDAAYHDQVVAFHESLVSKERIELFGYRSDVGVLLSGADVFVINSFYEGWSLAATEALTTGLPLIHTECGSGHELVGENGERGILIPNPAGDPLNLTWNKVHKAIHQKEQISTPVLVNAMSQMVTDREMWRSRRDSIRSYAISAFSRDLFLHRYSELFLRVMREKLSPSFVEWKSWSQAQASSFDWLRERYYIGNLPRRIPRFLWRKLKGLLGRA